MCVSLIPLSVSPSSITPLSFSYCFSPCLTISPFPQASVSLSLSLSLSVRFAPLLAGSCLSDSQKQITPLPCLDVHPRSALTDLAGQGADENERLEEQVQEPQELRVSVVKAFSEDNGADDVGGDGVEVEDGILEGS